jgi:hypothetical protein
MALFYTVIHMMTTVAPRTRSSLFSARMDDGLIKRLKQRGRLLGQPGSRLAERYIDEGLRMEEFPGIVFRTGPTGRRAGLLNGPDVWEIVADIQRAVKARRDPIATVARTTNLRADQIRLAAAYYDAFPDEIDQRIREDEAMAARAARTLSGIARPR